MKNFLYYLKNYGNLSFKENPFNEIDALILCQLGYLNMDVFSENNEENIYLSNVILKKNSTALTHNTIMSNRNIQLIKAIEGTTRYNNIYFSNHSNEFCTDKLKQFFAVTYFIDDIIFIAFRGTDLSIVGWQEDFMMAYLDEVPSQKAALDYVNNVYYKYKKPLIIGGHSKGGNLALYSAIYADKEVIDNTIAVFDFDGPGFNSKDIFEKEEFLRIKNKLHAYTASTSIIAMLMYNVDNMQFLKSSGIGLLQHVGHYWHIRDSKSFKRVKTNNMISKFFSSVVSAYMDVTTIEERRKLIDMSFYIAKERPKSTLFDVKRHPIKYVLGMHARRKLLTKEERNFYKIERKKLMNCISKAIKSSININIDK